jgi:hypothetical protein
MDSAKNMKKKSMAKILCGHSGEFPKKIWLMLVFANPKTARQRHPQHPENAKRQNQNS